MVSVFEKRAICVILVAAGGEGMANVFGMVRARVVDMFEERAECIILVGL